MGNLVKGKNMIIELLSEATYYPIFCAKSGEFNLEQDELETTSINSTTDREYIAGMSNATVSLTGITQVDNTEGRISILYLMQQAIRRATHSVRIRFVADNGTTQSATFSAIIRNTNVTKDRPTYSQSFVTFRVSGAMTFGDVVTPPTPPSVQTPLYLDTTPGATFVTHASLTAAGVVILEVQREGLGYTEIPSGTPTNRQFLFTAASGRIDFDTNIPFNSGEVVYVLYKV